MADHPREADRLIYAGLLGLAAASVIQLLEQDQLDLASTIGMYVFAAAIPLLAVGLITDYARRAGTHIPLLHEVIGGLGALLAVVGFGALFFHFHVWIGVVFVGFALFSVLLIRGL